LQVANGNILPITHIGSTILSKSSSPFILSKTLCAPSVTKNLVFVSQLYQTNDVSIEFFPWHFEVKELHKGKVLLRGLDEDNVCKFNPNSTIPQTSLATIATSLQLWHHRLGHPAPKPLLHALKINNVPFIGSSNACHNCFSNKSHKLPFSKSTIFSNYPLKTVYSDVWGRAPFNSIDGFRYYVIFIDHFCNYVWLYPMKFKYEVSVFPHF